MLGAVQAGAVLAMLGFACAWLRAVRFAQPGPRLREPWWRAGGAAAQLGAGGERGVFTMLRIYSVLLELIRDVMPLVRELERREPDLARQCRRALASAPLNVAEGSQSRGRNRGARYSDALGSLREALACFEVAEVMGYLPALSAERVAKFNHVIGTLVRVTQGPPRR